MLVLNKNLDKNPRAMNPLLLLNFKKIYNVELNLRFDETIAIGFPFQSIL